MLGSAKTKTLLTLTLLSERYQPLCKRIFKIVTSVIKVITCICQSSCMYFSPLCQSNQAKFDRDLEAWWSFCSYCWTEVTLVVGNFNFAMCWFDLDIRFMCGNSQLVSKVNIGRIMWLWKKKFEQRFFIELSTQLNESTQLLGALCLWQCFVIHVCPLSFNSGVAKTKQSFD